MSPSVSEIRDTLVSLKSEVKRQFHIELRGIFGSFVRGEEQPESDIDILVECLHETTLFDVASLSMFLEDRLQRSVDIIPERSIRPEIRSNIIHELIRL